MGNTQNPSQELNIANKGLTEPLLQEASEGSKIALVLKKLRGGFFLLIGYLLSPLSWWNDLFFNLPVAYGFGYLCSLFSPNLLIPCAIAGYWLSNIAGILLMQAGAVDVFQNQPQETRPEKRAIDGFSLFNGLYPCDFGIDTV